MHRVFVSTSELNGNILTLRAGKARYLFTVLRCTAGTPLVVTDNEGKSYHAVVRTADRAMVTAEILGATALDTESPLALILIQGLLKGDKMDLVIQKATELGVSEIIPVVTARSQLRETRKLPRWRKIAEEAARQSERNTIPLVTETMPYKELFPFDVLPGSEKLIFWEKRGENLTDFLPSLPRTNAVAMLTGPEGGFAEEEVSLAENNGFRVLSLGRRILRAETAAIAALAIIQYALGDLGRPPADSPGTGNDPQ